MHLSLILLLSLFASPEQALQAWRAGQDLDGRVSTEIAAAAVERLAGARVLADDLPGWLAVARAGGLADPALVQPLLRVVARGAPDAAGVALAEAMRLPEDTLEPALAQADAALAEQLRSLARSASNLTTRQVACELLPRVVPSAQLPGLLGGDELETLSSIVRGFARAPEPTRAYDALLWLDVDDPELAKEAGRTLRVLVERGASAAALEAIQMQRWGPGGAALRSLSALPPDRWNLVRRVVGPLLDSAEDADLLIAALDCAAALRFPEVLPLSIELAREAKRVDVRVAAIEAILQVGYRDAPTVDLLIELLESDAPEVRAAAYRALCRKSGARGLSPEPALWHLWRRGNTLPAEPPVSTDERLERERRALARRRIRGADRK